MKDYVLELTARQTGFNAKLNIMREYLQSYALKILYEQGVFHSTAFLGGTALRFLHNLPRFSEDLDFSTVSKMEYSFVDIIKKVKEEFILAGYDLSVSYKDKKNVYSAFLGFTGLMYEAGISPLKSQKLSIKIDIDTNPPAGAQLKSEIVNKYFPIAFLSYDTASLFAGKLHALLNRKYIKGRDFFDLGWYLSRWKDISPNMTLLKNSLIQTGWKGKMPAKENWRNFFCDIVEHTDWQKVKADVVRFLENPADMDVFSQENLLNLIRQQKP